MEEAGKGELRKRLEALQLERERCEEKKVGLFRAVNRLKQGLQEGSIDEQRYNEELAKLGPSPQQIISGCNEEIKGIQNRIIDCEEQLRKLAEARNKDAITFVVVLAALMLFSVGTAFLTVQITSFLIKEEVTAYSQEISVNFTQPQQYVLNISKLNISGELRSLSLSGKLIGEGQARVYLQEGDARYLVFDAAALQEKGIKSLISITGRAVEDVTEAAEEAADKNADKKAANEIAEADITQPLPQPLPQESNLTVNETPQQEQQEQPVPEPEPVPVPVEKVINVSLAYNSGTVFDSNDDGIELDISAIDFTVEQTNFSWPADQSKLCTRWVINSLDNGTGATVCQGNPDCCALVELAPSETSWNDPFHVFVGRDGATYNNTISSQVIFANYSLEPGNVYSEIYYSQFVTLPAVFVSAPKLENITEEVPVTNVTVIEFSNICEETCSLAGIAGLNLSEYTLVVEVDNATLVLDNVTYALAKVTEIDSEAPVVAILLPKNITYVEALEADEARNTTTLSLDFTVSEPADMVWYVLNGQGNVTIAAGITNAAITAANGTNTLVLFATDEAGNAGYAVAGFFVNFTTQPAAVIDAEPPIITIASPLPNATYNTTAVELNFTVNEPANVSYFLNLQNKTEITYNVTLAAEEGRNRLLLLATDAAGNVGSATVIFFVNTNNATINVTAAAADVNITPLLKATKASFKPGEDAQLDFEYIKKTELVNVGKWKDGYEQYEEDYKDYLETLSVAKKAAVTEAVAAEKVKAKRRQAGEWTAPNETIAAQVFDSEGRKASIGAEIEELREGRFSIKLPKQRQFRAGLYKVVVELERDGKLYTVEQDFTWGVLAINTNKSIFLPNEDALIAMAVLDNQGRMVCDADVTLTITDPSNAATMLTTANGKINVSPECHVYGVTNLPDYYTTYAVKGVGTYVMNLTAVTANGVRTILDNFTVQSAVDFDIARAGPTRIYPLVPYVMNITIAANINYNGPVIEYVPASFEITPQQGLTVTTVADAKVLSWNVQLKKGETISLSYVFDAPDVSPYLYTVGRLQVGTFTEARDWMVASDVLAAGEKEATKLTAKECLAMVSSATANTFTSACDGTYPAGCGASADLVSCNDGTSEIHSRARNKYAGVNITVFNDTITNCDAISSVRICVQQWGAGTLANCLLSVDDARGASWSTASTTCPGPTEPTPITCVDASALETWTCGDFFGASTTKANAKVEHTRTSTGGASDHTIDVLYFNVTYTEDTTQPNNSIITPVMFANISGSFLVNASINDSASGVSMVNATLWNNTGRNVTAFLPMNLGAGTTASGWWNVTIPTTALALADGNYNVSVNATDIAGNTNISANVSIIIDNTKPNATAISPSNGTVINTITINASVNDTLTKVFNATFRLTTSTGSTLTSWLYATNGTGNRDQGYWNTTFDTTTVPDGTYNITINATDYAGNQQVLNLSQITIDNIPNILKVDLGIPPEGSSTEISQNATFNVTANVTCNDACGNVNATLRYNISGLEPNENISTQNGTTPFYITGARGAAVASYDFNATYWPSTLHNASYNSSQIIPPSDLFLKDIEFDGGTTATANNYSNIKVLRDGWYARFASDVSSTYATQKFTVRINETEATISKLNITINFTGGQFAPIPNFYTTNVNVSVWNSSAWETFLNCAASASGDYFAWCLRNISITQNIANYINESDNNAAYILVQTQYPRSGAGTSEVVTDYISLDVTTNVTTTGTTNPYSCGNMAAGESCNVTWTVNATLPLGSEWYIDVNFSSDDSLVQSNDTGNAQIKNITVVAAPDTTAPNVTIIVPLQNSNLSGSFLINASVNDSQSNVRKVNLTIYNNTGNATGLIPMNISSGGLKSGYWNKTFDSTTLRDGRYNLSVNATDSAATPNTAISANASIIIDNTKPNATISSPSNNANLTNLATVTVDVLVNDTLAGVFNVRVRMINSTNGATDYVEATLQSGGTIYAGTWQGSISTTGLAETVYNITASANDTAGNIFLDNISTISIGSNNIVVIGSGFSSSIGNVTTSVDSGNISFLYNSQEFLKLRSVVAIRSANISFRNVTELVNESESEGIEGNLTNVTRRFVENVSYSYKDITDVVPLAKLNYTVRKTDVIKFAPNLTRIPQIIISNENISVGLKVVKGWENLTVSDTELAHTNGLILNLGDLIGTGFEVSTDMANRAIIVGNLAAGYDGLKQQLLLDPSLQESCGTLSSANTEYQLTQDVSSTGTCFTVAADNVTIDCQGYKMLYANFSAGNAIDNTGVNSTTVKNCIIAQENGTISGSAAFNIVQSNNSVIINNTINTTGNFSYGIELQRSNFTNISGNKINTTGNFSYALTLLSSSLNNLTENTASTQGTSNAYGMNVTRSTSNLLQGNTVRTAGRTFSNLGIYLLSSPSNNITSNTINTSGTSSNYGILFSSSSSGTVTGNTINTSGTSSSNIGIYFLSSSSGTATSNTIRTRGTSYNYGILFSSSSSGTATSNTVSASGTVDSNYGIYFSSSSSETATSNTISTSGTSNNYGILFITSSSGTVTGNTVNTSGTSGSNYGMYILGEFDNNNMLNNIINTSASSSHGIFMEDSGGSDPDFNNVTNNVIRTTGATAHGIYLETDVEKTIVKDNIINTTSTGQGIRVELNINNNVTGNNITTSAAAAYGIMILSGRNSSYTKNRITTTGSGAFGMQIDNTTTGLAVNNTVYDNIFNTTAKHINITHPSVRHYNNFSLSAITSGTNIVGGANLGGNFYDNSTVGGQAAWSLNCTDSDTDGICDTSLTHAGNNTDFFPLAAAAAGGAEDINGSLDITLNNPTSINVTQNSTFSINASIICDGGNCHEINGTAYYNWSGTVSTRINVTVGNTPVYNATGLINQSCGFVSTDGGCSYNLTINATGPIGSYWNLTINFTSNNTFVNSNGSRMFQLNISQPVVTNTAPIAFNSSVALNSSVTLSEGTTKVIAIKFNVTDADGTSDIVNAAVGVNITFNGVRRANNSGNCANLGDSSSTTRLFSCNVTFNYFDNASSIWEINMSAADAAGLVGYNDSTPGRGGSAANNLTINSLSAFSIVADSLAATANINTQDNELSFVVNNTGNFDFTLLNVTPFDLNASLTDFFRLNGNFSINATASTSGGLGDNLVNGTPRNFTASQDQLSATMPHKITNGEADNLGNRTLYIYIDIPSNKGISSGVTYNSSTAWQLFAS